MKSQIIQLLLNLQLQSKTIAKYDKYFTHLSENGLISVEAFDAMDEMMEEEEEEDEYDDDSEEEKSFPSDPTPPSTKAAINSNSDPKDNSRMSKMKGNGKSKGNVANPYLKKNPYLVKQNKRR